MLVDVALAAGKLINRAELGDEEISVASGRAAFQRQFGPPADGGEAILRQMPGTRIRRGKDVKLVIANRDGRATVRDERLVALMIEAAAAAAAAAARNAVLAEPDRSLNAIAIARGQCRTRVAKLVRLSWLAPAIVEAIASGQLSPPVSEQDAAAPRTDAALVGSHIFEGLWTRCSQESGRLGHTHVYGVQQH